MSKRFKDKVVWVTGASSGVGEGLVRAFYDEGARLVLSGRRQEELARVLASFDDKNLPMDVTNQEARESAVSEVIKHFDRIDILVNNAGTTQRSLTIDTDFVVDQQIMELNYFAPVALTKLVLPHMLETGGGHMVVTSSVAGKLGVPLRSAYCASKHALHGFYDTLRLELGGRDIRVTLLVLGAVQTNASINALTGDGTPYAVMDPGIKEGMLPEECVAIALNGIAKNKHEIMIARSRLRRWILLKRISPRILDWSLKRVPTT